MSMLERITLLPAYVSKLETGDDRDARFITMLKENYRYPMT